MELAKAELNSRVKRSEKKAEAERILLVRKRREKRRGPHGRVLLLMLLTHLFSSLCRSALAMLTKLWNHRIS